MGRGTSLPPLLTAHADRPCRGGRAAAARLTVLSGGDVMMWDVAPETFDKSAVAPFGDGTFGAAFAHAAWRTGGRS